MMWAMPVLNYNLASTLQLRKSTENLSQGSRMMITQHFSATKMNLSILFKDISPICNENHTKPISKKCRVFLFLKQVVHIVRGLILISVLSTSKTGTSFNLYFSIPFALLDPVFIFMPSLKTFRNVCNDGTKMKTGTSFSCLGANLANYKIMSQRASSDGLASNVPATWLMEAAVR
jgi:hypothetical protein